MKKFESEVAKTKSLQFDVQQQIVETENRINFLLARQPQPVSRQKAAFEALKLLQATPNMAKKKFVLDQKKAEQLKKSEELKKQAEAEQQKNATTTIATTTTTTIENTTNTTTINQ